MASFTPQTRLREIPVDPKATAILYVDVQNFNCHRGGAIYRHYTPEQLEGPEFQYFWDRLEEITPNWQKLQAAGRQCGVEILYCVIQSLTKDGRDRSLDYKITGFHVPPGSWDAKVLECIRPETDEIVLPKTSSSVFMSTNLDYLLRSMEKKFLVICGCLTDQCVEHAVRDACDLGYYVTLVADACATYSDSRHETALQTIKGYCRLRHTDSVVDELRAAPATARKKATPARTPKSSSGDRPPLSPSLAAEMSELQPSSKKERKLYFEYAKSTWETEDEFKLPNNESWVEVVIRGDPNTGERGLVYCRLCKHQNKNNIFGKGYRAGKRSALREHMATKDHRELVELLLKGAIPPMPAMSHSPGLGGGGLMLEDTLQGPDMRQQGTPVDQTMHGMSGLVDHHGHGVLQQQLASMSQLMSPMPPPQQLMSQMQQQQQMGMAPPPLTIPQHPFKPDMPDLTGGQNNI